MTNTVEIHGHCDQRFSSVKEAFARNFESGEDIGASFAATIDGKFVVDIWGGYADAVQTRPWQRDTIVNVYSTTKAMTALCALMLVDRGLLDLDVPVAHYWPEFAQAGKEKLPVRYLLSHRAGLAGSDTKVLDRRGADRVQSAAITTTENPRLAKRKSDLVGWWSCPGEGDTLQN